MFGKVQRAHAILASRICVDIKLAPKLKCSVAVDHFHQRTVIEITHAPMEEARANIAIGLYDSRYPWRIADWRHRAFESKGRAKVTNQCGEACAHLRE